jgi:pyrroloquinoline quinone (PQQ) biosynthesis protein C
MKESALTGTLSPSTWKAELRAMVDEHPLLEHSFFDGLRTGALGKEDLLRWAHQDRIVSYTFPRLIALIVASLDLLGPRVNEGRMALVENLWEEMGEGQVDRAHSTLMDDLLVSLGVGRDALDVPALPATERFLQVQLDLARDRPFAGMGAFCYGNEYLVLQEYPPVRDALLRHWPKADIRFFLANQEVDGHHTELVEHSIACLASDPNQLEDVRYGAMAALEARISFYDELLEASSAAVTEKATS